jgi:hypothetical protein
MKYLNTPRPVTHLSGQVLAEAAHFIPSLQSLLPAGIAAVSPVNGNWAQHSTPFQHSARLTEYNTQCLSPGPQGA